jgi:hypothetical protein
VGGSVCGSGETGKRKNATVPASATPSVSKVVATGREMNGAEMFITRSRIAGLKAQRQTARGLLRLRKDAKKTCFNLIFERRISADAV